MGLAGLARGPALLGLLLLVFAPSSIGAASASHGKLQAALIYRLASFVEWPDGSLPEGSFRVAVVGAPEVASELERLSEKRKLAGRAFEVQRIEAPGAGGFDLLFLGTGEDRGIDAALAQRTPNVLTMSNAGSFAKRGGMIQLITVGGRKVKFEINRDASEQAGLRISSRLLELAAKVHSAAGGK